MENKKSITIYVLSKEKTTRSCSPYAATPHPPPDLSQNHAQKNAIRKVSKTQKPTTEAKKRKIHDIISHFCIFAKKTRFIPRQR
jgi:hypothetical protein